MLREWLCRASRNTQAEIKKHGPDILTVIGIAGMIYTVIIAVKATPKALADIEDKKIELDQDYLTIAETVKAAGRCYIPTAATGLFSTICIIGANSMNARRNAALIAAYTLSESAVKEYQEKVVEAIGEKKERSIREKAAGEKMAKDPVREVILTEKGGDTTCYDVVSGRYFKSDRDTIARTVNEMNRRMYTERYVTLNDFYYELGLDPVKIGDDLGWNIDRGYIDLLFSSHLDAKGTPCLVMDYQIAPVYDYI
jgi:hypothetical protein